MWVGVCGVLMSGLVFWSFSGLPDACGGVLVGVDGFVLSATVATSVGCSQRAVGVCWYQMVGCEWVLCSSVAFSAYPAVCCCVSYLLCSALVVACVVWSVGFWVRSVPFGLAWFASCAVGGEGTTGQTGLANWHLV